MDSSGSREFSSSPLDSLDCMTSSPVPSDSTIMMAIRISTYSSIPSSSAYFSTRSRYARTSSERVLVAQAFLTTWLPTARRIRSSTATTTAMIFCLRTARARLSLCMARLLILCCLLRWSSSSSISRRERAFAFSSIPDTKLS